MSIHISIHGLGKHLVLFHGWGFDSQIWSTLLPVLQNEYQLYLVDLPGFGLTPYMNWETFKTRLLIHLPDSFALLGWSMGGLYATRLALENPDRVTHLINVASSPRFLKDNDWPGVDKQVFAVFYENLSVSPEQTLMAFINLQLGGHAIGEPVITHNSTPAGLEAGLELLSTWDFRQRLNEFNKPACYMFGRLDAITPRQLLTTMQINYPNFEYVLFPKAAHIPFLSHPEEFINSLRGFLE